MDTADLAKILTVPFAAGFVVQRLLEICDPVFVKLFKNADSKRVAIGIVSAIIGWLLAGFGDIRIFHALQPLLPGMKDMPCWLDIFASGIFISAGTEGFNSLMKFANYKKEASKADAANKLSTAPANELRQVNPQQ
jgi:hypothetical protein